MTLVQQQDSLEQLFDEAVVEHAEPLWPLLSAVSPPFPVAKAAPYVWRYEQLRPFCERAARLVGTDLAERRVFMLVNPKLKAPYTTDTLYAGLQTILPGETARAHRHSPFALRFIIEGERGFTAVEGEKVMMERGDMVLTPSWEWHDHGNEGDRPMIWLDGLDLPLWQVLPSNFTEHYAERALSVGTAEHRIEPQVSVGGDARRSSTPRPARSPKNAIACAPTAPRSARRSARRPTASTPARRPRRGARRPAP